MSIRINVGHLEGKQPEAGEVIGQIGLTQSDSIFAPVATFLVSLLSFGALAETYKSGGSQPWGTDHYICLDASAAALRLTVPGQPIASAVVANQWPTQITFNLAAQPKPYDGTSHLGEIGPYVFSAMQGMFTAFYEEHVETVATAHSAAADWPDVWKFGRIVRNALSHGGDLNITKPTTATWQSLTYSQSDHGKPIILVDLWPGDLIVLLKDMQDALSTLPE